MRLLQQLLPAPGFNTLLACLIPPKHAEWMFITRDVCQCIENMHARFLWRCVDLGSPKTQFTNLRGRSGGTARPLHLHVRRLWHGISRFVRGIQTVPSPGSKTAAKERQQAFNVSSTQKAIRIRLHSNVCTQAAHHLIDPFFTTCAFSTLRPTCPVLHTSS